MIKHLVGTATALAIVIGAASPAAARGWGRGFGGHYGGHFRHHRGGDTFGNILLGAVIGGGLIAVANSANRDKERSLPSRRGEDQRDDLRQNGSDAREVASMCSDAVETMARGRVSSIDSVDRDGGGWRVDGVVDAEHDGDRHFYCDVVDGRIENVQLSNREDDRRSKREPYKRTYPG